uniref:Uncharacterized protein n=1 Tax=Anopheles darlingi TaxID=43151 RepID=A0A2M4D5K4_ANODA
MHLAGLLERAPHCFHLHFLFFLVCVWFIFGSVCYCSSSWCCCCVMMMDSGLAFISTKCPVFSPSGHNDFYLRQRS